MLRVFSLRPPLWAQAACVISFGALSCAPHEPMEPIEPQGASAPRAAVAPAAPASVTSPALPALDQDFAELLAGGKYETATFALG